MFIAADVDECMEGTDNCEQLCRNTIGGYECSCLPPFSLTPTNASCSTGELTGTLLILATDHTEEDFLAVLGISRNDA